jgi:hypothetical protein
VYWILEEAIVFESSEDLRHVEDLARGLCDLVGGDRAATDASRTMRVPGSLNFKANPPWPVAIART